MSIKQIHFQKLFQKTCSVLANFSLFLHIFLPYLAAIPAHAADISPISYSDSAHKLSFSLDNPGSISYQLFYKTDTKIDAVAGNSLPEYLFLGTCSDNSCLPQNFDSAILKTKSGSDFHYYYFTLKNGQLQIVKEGTSSQFDLSDEENNFLSSWTFEKVELNREYESQGVKLTFTRLPENSGNIKIEEITLTPEQIKQTGSLSDKAYDITSDMEDKTFAYNLILPIPESAKDKNVDVKFAEDISEIDSAQTVDNTITVTNTDTATSVSISDLDHFTIFVVTIDVPSLTGSACISEGASSGSGCYNSIQDAITAATDGTTINVKAGTYEITSTIVVNKQVNIVGPSTGIAKIVNTSTPSASVFRITASNVSISGFELTVLKSFDTAGTEVANAIIAIPSGLSLSNISINNNNIHASYPSGTLQENMWARGITVDNNSVTSLSITNNTISNVRNGVVVRNVNTANVSNNTIFNTKGGIMHYTGSQADANNRIMVGNNWTDIHNEWDIVWNSGGGPYEPDYNQSVLVLSGANNNGYVLSLMTTDTTGSLTGNRSHVFVNATTGTTAKHKSSGNQNLPYKTIALGAEAVVPGGTVYVAAGTYALDSQIRISKGLNIIGVGDSTIITKGSSDWTNTTGSKGYAPLITINSGSNAVKLENFKVTGAKDIAMSSSGTDYGSGINVVSSSNVTLKNITSTSNAGAGLVVNSSNVTAENLNTSSNGWGGVNIDKSDSGNSVFTLTGTGILAENFQIYSDKTEGATVNAVGYTPYKIPSTSKTVWYNRLPSTPTGLTAKFQYDSQYLLNGSTINKIAKPNNNNLELLWQAPSTLESITGYRILTTRPDGTTSLGYQGPNTNAWLMYNGFGASGNGKYSYQVIAVNANGTSTSSEPFVIYYDTNIPTATFTTAPADNSYVKGNFDVAGTAQDNVALGSVLFDVREQDGDPWISGCKSGTTNLVYSNEKKNAKITCTIDTGNLVNGTTYMLRIHVGDNAGYGNVNPEAIRYFTMDRIAPTITVNPFITSDNTPQITGTINDNTASISVKIGLNTFSANNNNNGTWTLADNTITPALADGTYDVIATATDTAGNSSTDTTTGELIIDTTSPSATINGNSPKDFYNYGDTNIGVHSIDNNYLETRFYSGSSTTPFKIYTDVYFGISWLSDGAYRMVVVDKAGNSTEYTFTIDRSIPTSTIFVQGDLDESKNITVNNRWFESFDNVDLKINIGNTATDTINYQILDGDINCLASDSAGYTAVSNNINIAPTINTKSDGSYSLCYFAKDLAGNKETIIHKELLKKDNTDPTFKINSISGNLLSGVYYNKSDISIGITINDVSSGYSHARYDLYNADSNHNCTTFINSNQDNTVSTSNPTTVTLSKTGLNNENYCFRVWVYDKVQNKAWTDSSGYNGWVKFTIDNENPIVSFSGLRHYDYRSPSTPVDTTNTSTNDNTPIVLISASDSLSGMSSVTVNGQTATYDGSTYWIVELTTLSDGAKTLEIVGTDKAGNKTTVNQGIFIDTVAPTAKYIYYRNGTAITDSIVYVKGVDELSFTALYSDDAPSSGILKDSYVIFDSNEAGTARTSVAYCGWRNPANTLTITENPILFANAVPFTNCKAPLNDGAYFMYHQVYDNATRRDIPKITQYRDVKGLHFVVDTVAPIITLGTYTTAPTNQDITVTASTDEGTLNTTTHTFTANGSFDFIATDAAGNTSSETVTINNIDKTLPISTITTFDLASGNTVTTNSWNGEIAGTASDSLSGVNKVELTIQNVSNNQYWNGSAWQTAETNVTATETTSWTYQISSAPADGTYKITSHATDNAGNTENSYTITIVLDKTIPEVDISLNPTVGDASNGWYKTQPTITLTPADDNFDRIEYQWDSKAEASWTSYSSPFKLEGEGAHVLYYRAIDKANNISEVGVKNIAWDQTDLEFGPQNISADPNPTSGSTSKIKWEVAKDNTGIDKYEVQWKLNDVTNPPSYSKTVGSGTTEVEIDQLTEGRWTVKVVAFDGSGRSKDNSIDVVVDRSGPVAPVLTLTGTGAGTATLSWNAIADAQDYIIWYGNAPGSRQFGAKVGNVTSYTVRGLGSGNYYFIVRAVDSAQNQGADSNEVSTGTISGAANVEPGTPAEGFTPEVLGENISKDITPTPTSSPSVSNILGVSTENIMQWWWLWFLLLIPLYFIFRRLFKRNQND